MHQESLGVHYILDLFFCNVDLLNDSTYVISSIKEAIFRANANLLEDVKYEFTPQGFTAIFLLSESHISIHTWPEKEYAAVDIFTCGAHTKPNDACNYLIDVLESKKPVKTIIKRGKIL